MEFRDLKQQYQHLQADLDKAVAEVMSQGQFIGGGPVADLEKTLADYVGVKHCLTCANGTDALSLVLMAWGIGPGHAVFVPDFTFFATAEVISFAGATPIFVAVDDRTFNLDPEDLKAAIAEVEKSGRLEAKAVIPVDLFGLPANYPEILKIAQDHDLLVLADSAQGFGGRIGDRVNGSFGQAATTSFFPAKPLGCYGDGGAVFTNDSDLADLVLSFKVHGKGSYKYDNVRIGVNSRLDTIQAAILKVKLQAFKDHELKAVNWAADLYRTYLDQAFVTPQIPEDYLSSYAQFTLLLDSAEEREFLQKALKARDIPTMVYYPIPLHRQKAFAYLGEDIRRPANTASLCERVLSLPMHPYLSEQDVARVSENLLAAHKDFQATR